MKSISREVSGNAKVPGIGEQKRSKDVSFDLCESMDDVRSVLTGNTADEKEKSLIAMVNDARWSELRAKTYAQLIGTGKKSVIGTIKKTLKQFEILYPEMNEAERSTLVLGLPGMREKLEAEGLTLEAVSAADETESDETPSDETPA